MEKLNFVLKRHSETDSKHSWFLAVCCFFYNFLVLGFSNATGTMFVHLHQTFAVSREEASLPINMMICSRFILSIISGPLLHKLGTRSILFWALMTSFIGAILPYWSPMENGILWLTVCMAIRGLGMCVVRPVLMHVTSSHFTNHRAKALFVLFSSIPISGIVFPFIEDYAVATYGLRGSWLIQAAITLQALLLVMLIRTKEEQTLKLADNPKELQSASEPFIVNGDANNQIIQAPMKSNREKRFLHQLVELLRSPKFYLLLFGLFSALGSYTVFFMIAIDYGRDKHLPPVLCQSLLGIFSVGDLTPRFPFATILDKKLISYELVMALSFGVAFLSYLLMTFSTGYAFLGCIFAVGVAYGVGLTAISPMYSMLGSRTVATTYGLHTCAIGFAMLIIPKLIGHFRDILGTYDYMIYLLSLTNGVMMVTFFVSRSLKI